MTVLVVEEVGVLVLPMGVVVGVEVAVEVGVVAEVNFQTLFPKVVK